jgi:stage V sporulation protein B
MLNGAAILALSMILVKIIGMVYKLPLVLLYGAEGKGFFTNAFELYTPIYAIAITGLPIAVSRMVSERTARCRYNDVRTIYKVTRKLFLWVGLAGLAAMLLLAWPYANYICTGGLRSLPAIFAIAPAIFFCCAMSIHRGYYEGLRNMIPTAVSQVIEALCKMILGIALAILCMRMGTHEFETKGTVFGMAATADNFESLIYPWAAAASIIGITAGTVLGYIYLVFYHRAKGDGITKEMLINAPPSEDAKKLMRELGMIAIPVVLSSAVLTITNFIDNIQVNWLIKRAIEKYPEVIERIYGSTFNSPLRARPVAEIDKAPFIRGLYATVMDFRSLIPTIVTSLGVSALPAISAAWAVGHKENVQKTINSVMRIALVVSLPAGFGLAVLSKEILTLFYEADVPGIAQHTAPILFLFGLSTALMSISGPITSILQGIGRTDVPVKSIAVGAVVKIVSNFILVGNPEINIQGAPYSTILCYVAIVAVNLIVLLRVTKVRVRVMSVLIKPLLCAGLSAAAAWAGKGLILRLPFIAGMSAKLQLLAMIAAAMAAAVVVYAVTMLLCRAFTKDDLEMLPKGEKIAEKLDKIGLLG